jgi:hypothetical protein
MTATTTIAIADKNVIAKDVMFFGAADGTGIPVTVSAVGTPVNEDSITDCNSYMKQLLADKAEIDLMQTRGSALLRGLLARCYKLYSQMEVEKDEVLQTAFNNYTEQRGFKFKGNVKTMNKILYTVFCNSKTYKDERKNISAYATGLNAMAELNVAAGDALQVLNSKGIENLRKKDSKKAEAKISTQDKHYLACSELDKQQLFVLDSAIGKRINVGTQVGNMIVFIGNRQRDGSIVIRAAEHNSKLIDLVRENYFDTYLASCITDAKTGSEIQMTMHDETDTESAAFTIEL